MRALPAIDLRGGACVQLVGGDYDEERVRLPDPVAQARAFVAQGCGALHVVDLDAATGRGENAAVVERIVREAGASVQVGGGVRDLSRAEALLALGAERVVVGTRAIEDRAFREEAARALPGRIVLALDVRGTEVLVRGWKGSTGLEVTELLAELEELPLAGLLVTAVHREGRLEGADASLYRELCARTRHPVQASGGVTDRGDLAALAEAGCSAAVIGMALYTGKLDGPAVAREFFE